MNLCIRCVPISVIGDGVGAGSDEEGWERGDDATGEIGAGLMMVDDSDVLSWAKESK